MVTVRPNEKIYNLYRGVSGEANQQAPEWVTFDGETLRATMVGTPGPEDISLPVNANIVIEFLSR